MQQVDTIIIGSGQGGVPLAVALAEQGKQVVVFERGALGGTCTNTGCTPSKAFLAAAHAAGRARHAQSLGIHAQIEVDFDAVMQHVRGVRDQWNAGVTKRLDHANIELLCAEASFVGERTVQGGGQTFQAPMVLINTGGQAVVPKLPGIDNTPFLTSSNFWEITELPARTLAMGGGYIGLELGQGLARLGSEVHVIDRNERPMSREEPDVGDTLQEALEADGVQFHLQASIQQVAHADGVFTLSLDDGTQVQGEALLVATGRRPNTEALQVEQSGIELDKRGFVSVDDRFETACAGVYAIGDVANQPPFTHVSWEDHRRLLAIMNGEQRTRNDLPLGYAVFTDPQVGRVGMTEDEAKQQGRNARAVTLPLSQTSRGIEWKLTRGFFRIVVDQDDDTLLGATFVGYEAAELVHIVLAHVMHGATWQDLARSMHIHPTFAEDLPTLARMVTR